MIVTPRGCVTWLLLVHLVLAQDTSSSNSDNDDMLLLQKSLEVEDQAEENTIERNTDVIENESRDHHTKQKRLPPNLLIERMIFLHMGKAGGGTVRQRAREGWNISFRGKHPYPPDQITRASFGTRFQAEWINLRDPVDRFVSAFYWRQMVLCDPEGDERTAGQGFVRLPDGLSRFCKMPQNALEQRESEALFYRYNRSAEELAAALCSTNRTKASLAAEDMKTILHAKDGIADWLGSNFRNYTDTMFPIILESGFDLESQVDDAIHWTYEATHFENEQSFEQRQAYANALPKRLKPDFEQHSSQSKKEDLSESSRACVADYYASDYSCLSQIRDDLCKTSVCRNAIQSILSRRG